MKTPTYSLAELFNQTTQPGCDLAFDMNAWNHPTGCNVFNARQDQYHTLVDYMPDVEEVEQGVPKRVAVLRGTTTLASARIFVRTPTGLYLPVGHNSGHPDGCFLRHDKQRKKRRDSQAVRNVANDLFSFEERAHF